MPKKTTSSDPLDAAIGRTLREVLVGLKQRRALQYDGITGSLYESWPGHHHNEFETAREWILKKVSHAEALRFLKDYQKIYEPNYYNGLATIPLAYQSAIGTLHYYYTAMQLGEEEGLRKLAGENAVVGFRVRTAHTKRKAARDKPNIQGIGKKYWAAHPKATVKDIQNCEEFKIYMKDKKPYAYRTIENWLREVDPRPLSAKRGPRSKKR